MLKVFFILILYNLIIFTLHFDLRSEEIQLNCKIEKELENNKNAKKKNYKEENLLIYLDEEEGWINDKKKQDWNEEFENELGRVLTFFKHDEKRYLFKYMLFHSLDKKKIESSFFLELDKATMYIKFKKFYFNFDSKVFFTSEVQGKCFSDLN